MFVAVVPVFHTLIVCTGTKVPAFNPLKVSKSAGAVDVINEDLIPEEYYIEVITTKLDKKRILGDLKEGASIPGVRLIQKEYVRGLK